MNIDFYTKQLDPLIGGKITSVISDSDGEFFGLEVTKGKKTFVIWFLQDDEGNGPGSFEIQTI